MAREKDIKEELLKQMDKDFGGSTDADKDSARKIIESHRGQVIRLKWIAAIGWLITIIYAVGIHNLKIYLLKYDIGGVLTRNEFMLIRFSDAGLMVLIVVAVLLTYLSYCRSRTLTMLQICARLAGIEEHLKRMSEGK
jgi:hypothetical protein